MRRDGVVDEADLDRAGVRRAAGAGVQPQRLVGAPLRAGVDLRLAGGRLRVRAADGRRAHRGVGGTRAGVDQLEREALGRLGRGAVLADDPGLDGVGAGRPRPAPRRCGCRLVRRRRCPGQGRSRRGRARSTPTTCRTGSAYADLDRRGRPALPRGAERGEVRGRMHRTGEGLRARRLHVRRGTGGERDLERAHVRGDGVRLGRPTAEDGDDERSRDQGGAEHTEHDRGRTTHEQALLKRSRQG